MPRKKKLYPICPSLGPAFPASSYASLPFFLRHAANLVTGFLGDQNEKKKLPPPALFLSLTSPRFHTAPSSPIAESASMRFDWGLASGAEVCDWEVVPRPDSVPLRYPWEFPGS
jgi:hypothetical protein